ncbi:hypothetical protein RND71_034212 [Anisodus tanguticus]|uniref:Pentatricopeptide repeat-containing protein n=1 Tax=Anisodus tanguticus TaxID=243964 RepID=A0AAE1UWU6_9SOLA|nr:hypothetical protein RND71_034212 [Anisodus tanguticus]
MINRREVCPDLDCLSSVLASCQLIGDLRSAKEIHAHGIKLESPFTFHRSSGPALLTLYVKCGRIQDARHVFELMDRTDVVAWNSMIHGFTELGMKESALEYFKEMLTIGIKINETTLSIVLPVCDLKYGKQIHAYIYHGAVRGMVSLPFGMHLFSCIRNVGALEMLYLHFLIRHRFYTENVSYAEQAYNSILAAALALQKVSIGVLASENLVELEPENPGHYVTLSSLYTKAGRISDALAVRKLMETKGLVKGSGCSWVVEGN